MIRVKFLPGMVFTVILFFTSCGDTETLAALEDRDYAFKILYDDVPTSGCWLRFRSDIHGVLEEKPWSAFLLTDDGKYFQSSYSEDQNISVDTNRSYWHQDVRDLIWIMSYRENLSVRMDINILGYYSTASHSFNTYTTVVDTNYTTKEEKKSDFHDVIVKDENYKSILGDSAFHPLCEAIIKEVEE